MTKYLSWFSWFSKKISYFSYCIKIRCLSVRECIVHFLKNFKNLVVETIMYHFSKLFSFDLQVFWEFSWGFWSAFWWEIFPKKFEDEGSKLQNFPLFFPKNLQQPKSRLQLFLKPPKENPGKFPTKNNNFPVREKFKKDFLFLFRTHI